MSLNTQQRQHRHAPEAAYSGKIFISGVGFIVTAGMWALLAYFRHSDAGTVATLVDAVLSGLHLLAGVAILKRLRLAWYGGIALALAGIALTLVDGYFLPVICDSALVVLLYLSRDDFFRGTEAREPGLSLRR